MLQITLEHKLVVPPSHRRLESTHTALHNLQVLEWKMSDPLFHYLRAFVQPYGNTDSLHLRFAQSETT